CPPVCALRFREPPMKPATGTVDAGLLRGLPWLLAGLAMFGPFAIDAIFPAFSQMGEDLRADKLAMQQTVSVYLIAFALMSVVHGPLSDALGRRRVILA